jgi:hypothetical protein
MEVTIIVGLLALTFLVLTLVGPFEFNLLSIRGGVPRGESVRVRGKLNVKEGEHQIALDLKKEPKEHPMKRHQ